MAGMHQSTKFYIEQKSIKCKYSTFNKTQTKSILQWVLSGIRMEVFFSVFRLTQSWFIINGSRSSGKLCQSKKQPWACRQHVFSLFKRAFQASVFKSLAFYDGFRVLYAQNTCPLKSESKDKIEDWTLTKQGLGFCSDICMGVLSQKYQPLKSVQEGEMNSCLLGLVGIIRPQVLRTLEKKEKAWSKIRYICTASAFRTKPLPTLGTYSSIR